MSDIFKDLQNQLGDSENQKIYLAEDKEHPALFISTTPNHIDTIEQVIKRNDNLIMIGLALLIILCLFAAYAIWP